MSFLSSFGGKKPSLAIDIGTTSIKIAEVMRTEKGFVLKNYALLEDVLSGLMRRYRQVVLKFQMISLAAISQLCLSLSTLARER
jgi:hypothetical protein